MEPTFCSKLIDRLEKTGSHICVGLDSRYDKIPDSLREKSIQETVYSFNKNIVDCTQDISVCFKMNVAFYAGFGSKGLDALAQTNEYIHKQYPGILTFADCKRSEMGESVAMIEHEIFDWLGFDCVMVTPWFGFDTVRDYLKNTAHGVCVYVHDSNPTAVEFQDLELKDGRRVYEEVAKRVSTVWNTNGNVMVEAGATYPKELAKTREIVGEDMPMLVAGIGPQGGSADSLKGLFGTHKKRLIANSSRGIIFAGVGKADYFKEVRSAATTLQHALETVA